jgi:subtilase family serine protease
MGYLVPGVRAPAASSIAKFVRDALIVPVLALVTLAVTSPAAAGEASTTLEGNHPDEAAEIAESAAASSRPLSMHLTMAIRNRAELDRVLADQQNPASPEYHHWLTPDEFTNRFGPTDADLAKITRWLTRKGFAVQSADAHARIVSFTGTVASAEKAFGVKIAATADGAMFANTADPIVPADVAPLVESIRGLDNMLASAPAIHRVAILAPGATAPSARINGKTAFGPNDLHTFYDQPVNLDGSGTDCMAIIEDSDFKRAGADAFNTQFGLPAFTGANFEVILVNGTNPGINSDGDETMVDVNYSHAMAPGAPIRVYIGDPTKSNSPLPDAIAQAVTDNACAAISVSFSFCGASKNFFKAEDSRFAQAAAQGQAVFVATGDVGSVGLKVDNKRQRCVPATKRGVNELAASPHASAIGGTEFTPNLDSNGDDVGSVAESTWNDSGGATGGGKSKIFKKPSFQSGLFKKDKRRDLPDISFGASPSSPGFFFGDPATEAFLVGGTSIGAPAWAGISELLSQENGSRIGNLNVRLYQLSVIGGANGIRDVTSGANGFNGVPGFSALTGFDKASGWGTVDIGVFVPAFTGK